MKKYWYVNGMKRVTSDIQESIRVMKNSFFRKIPFKFHNFLKIQQT